LAFTNKCELFGAVHEDAVNLVADHLMRQRPSLFNYGTADVAADRELWCKEIDPVPDVEAFHNPVMTIMPPLPVMGTSFGVNFCFQLVSARIDFHKSDLSLPPELNPPLQEQHFAGMMTVCGGIGCPPRKIVDRLGRQRFPHLPVRPKGEKEKEKEKDDRREPPPPPPPVRVLDTDELECFCIDVAAVGNMETVGNQLGARLDGLEIVDISPEGLEGSIECYLQLMIKLALIPRLRVAIETVAFSMFDLANIAISATPAPAQVPNNPAVEDDQLKVFIDVAVTP
jgi:hypothetical protein